MALRLIPDGRDGLRRPFDAAGFLLNGSSLALLLYGLDELGRAGADGRTAGAALGASVVLGWLAFRHAGRTAHPLVGLAALRVPTFRSTMAGGLLARTVISTLPFLLPLLFQAGLGLDPFASGLLVLWYGVANLGIKPLTSPILRRFGFRTVLIGNTLVNAAAIAGCALIVPATPLWVIGLLLLLAGASRSMQFTAVNTLAFADLPPEATTSANTLFNMGFQLAIGLGIGCGAVLLRSAEVFTAGRATTAPFQLVCLTVGAVALLPLLDFLRLRPDAGAVVSGHSPRSSPASI